MLGGQASGKFKLHAKEWHFGNSQQYGLGSAQPKRGLSVSGRLTFDRASGLDGMDPRIMAPVQTAVPENYGYRQWQFGLGLNAVIPLLPGAPSALGWNLNGPSLWT